MQQLNLQRLNAAWVSVIQLGLPHSIVQFAKKVTISSSVAVSRKGISHTELRSKRKGLHCMCFQCLVFIVKLQVCLTLFLTSLVASAQWRSEASARVLDDFARAHIACSRTLYAVCKLGTTALVPVNLLEIYRERGLSPVSTRVMSTCWPCDNVVCGSVELQRRVLGVAQTNFFFS